MKSRWLKIGNFFLHCPKRPKSRKTTLIIIENFTFLFIRSFVPQINIELHSTKGPLSGTSSGRAMIVQVVHTLARSGFCTFRSRKPDLVTCLRRTHFDAESSLFLVKTKKKSERKVVGSQSGVVFISVFKSLISGDIYIVLDVCFNSVKDGITSRPLATYTTKKELHLKTTIRPPRCNTHTTNVIKLLHGTVYALLVVTVEGTDITQDDFQPRTDYAIQIHGVEHHDRSSS